MIKFSVIKKGKTCLGIGLSHRNLELLAGGSPLLINAAEMRAADVHEIFIFYGKTEDHMMAEMRDMIGPDTKISRYDEKGDLAQDDHAT